MMTAKGARLAVQNVEPRTPNGIKAWYKIIDMMRTEMSCNSDCRSIEFPITFSYGTMTYGTEGYAYVTDYITLDECEVHRVVKALKLYGYDVVKHTTPQGKKFLYISWRDDESDIAYIKRQYEYYGNKLREKGVLR